MTRVLFPCNKFGWSGGCGWWRVDGRVVKGMNNSEIPFANTPLTDVMRTGI